MYNILIVLTLFNKFIKIIKAPQLYREYIPMTVVIFSGICLSFFLFFTLQKMESEKVKTLFTYHAMDSIRAIKREIENHYEIIDSVTSLFQASESVTREEFRTFVASDLRRHQDILSLLWIPRVVHSQRQSYEEKAQMDGYPHFQITHHQNQGKMVRADKRQEYYPAFYVEPLKGNELVLGFDMASHPVYFEAIIKARDTGKMTTSELITSGQGEERQYNFLIYQPIYRKKALLNTAEDRRRNILGFVAGLYRIKDMMDSLFRYLKPTAIDVHLYDWSNSSAVTHLYSYLKSHQSDRAQAVDYEEAINKKGLYISYKLNVADQKWLVLCRPVLASDEYEESGFSWLSLAGSLFITALFAAYLRKEYKTTQADQLVQWLSAETRGNKKVKAINTVLRKSLKCENDEAVAITCLNVAEEMTGSTLGFIAELNQNNRFDTIALSNSSWSECKMTKLDAVNLLKDMDMSSYWSLPLKKRRSVIVNNPDLHPDRIGIPQGHPVISCFLGVPLKHEGRTIGMIGLANKESGYTLADQHNVELLSVAFMEALLHKRSELQLNQYHKKLEELVNERTKQLMKVNEDLHKEVLNSRQIEEALKESEKKYHELFETMSSGVAVYEAKNNGQDFIFKDFNRSAERINEARKEDIIGRSVLEKFPGVKEFGLFEVFQRVWKTGNPEHFPVRFYHDDRISGWKENYVYRLSSGEVVAVHDDVTKRKQTEDALQKAYNEMEEKVAERTKDLYQANIRLKELDRLKSLFIASMSHELRTPLNSIIGFTGIILQGLTGEINAEQKDQLQRVYRSAKHLLALISDVIDISKIEAGKIDPYIESFELKEVIMEAIASLKQEIEKKELELEIDMPHKQQLTTDKRRLLQCFINYLSNAVKFTEKGKILITVDKIDKDIKIKVSDTGIGIKEQDMFRLFKDFTRFDSPLKYKYQGTGLGLYLTKKLVTEVLGGSVSAESHYGKGSTFILTVPKKITNE
jgi:signal transduction histidine kinase/CHASE1-domain containing sensor protein